MASSPTLPTAALVLGALATGCAKAAATEAADSLFEQYEVATGVAKHQTVLSGFLLGGATAELVLAHINDTGDRRLRLVGFDGRAWAGVLDAKLRPDAQFIDIASSGGRDRLIVYGNGRLSWFDPDSATERALVEVPARYKAIHQDRIPHVDITRDLNHDGRDDLAIPDADGFWISIQSSDGSFAEPMMLGPPEPFLDDIAYDDAYGPRNYGQAGISALTIPGYLSRIHEMDYDQDGRSDLVFWNEDHFEVHRQDARGLFDPVAIPSAADVPFDSDGAYSLAFGFSEENMFALAFGFREKTRRTVLHAIRDMDGDGVADLTTHSLEGRSLMRLRSLYQVHFGSPAGSPSDSSDDALSHQTFAADAGAGIQPRMRSGGLQPSGYSSVSLQDFDADGQVDVMFREIKIGIGGVLRALAGNSVAIDLEFYRMEDGAYPRRPSTTRKVRPVFDPLPLGNVFLPAVLVGDVDGDRRSDLLVGHSQEALHVFLGVPGPDLFSRQPRQVAVAQPGDERNVRLADLDRDDKQDVLVHRPSADGPHRLTVLIAR